MIDQYSRKINYLRLSVTDLCNLKCKYCMPEEGVEKKEHSDILRLEEYLKIVEAAAELGIDKIRLTGGEPLVRRGIIELVGKIARVEGIRDLAMTTNGLMLKQYAKPLKEAGLTRINISMDTLNPIKYASVTRGGNLQDVLDGIEAAKANKLLPIKLNVVLINGFNTDEVSDFIAMASDDIEVRFIELMPVGEASKWSKGRFISNNDVLVEHQELLEEIDEISTGPARYYLKKGTKGKVGFINPISSHFCDQCNRVRVTADGKLKTCLHTDEEIDLSVAFNNDNGEEQLDTLKAILSNSMMHKPKNHKLNDWEFTPITRSMNRIGG